MTVPGKKEIPYRSNTEDRGPVSLRRLIAYFAIFLIYCVLLLLAGKVLPAPYVWMSRCLLYTSLANTFVPLPVNPFIILLGKTHEPLFVALIAALGTMIANLNEYFFLGYLSGRRMAGRIKATKFYERIESWYRKNPFILLVFTNLLPIPIDPVRWLSISSGYPVQRYAAATFLGRLPRYFLLAQLGETFQVSNLVLILIVVVPVLWTAIAWLKRRRSAARQ